MAGARSGAVGSRRWSAVADLVPFALVVVATAVVDGVALHQHGTLASRGPLSDGALVLSAVSVLGVLGLPSAIRRGRIRRAGIRAVDAMSGAEFEERLAALYGSMGYEVHHSGGSGDFGADLVVERDGERAVVQAKRYRGAVGIEAVQQVVGAGRYYEADDAMVVTNSTCTPAARALASASGVRVVERDELVRLLAAHPEQGAAAPLRALWAQLLAGARLCAYAVGALLRLAWWVVRVLWRVARAAARGTG